MLIRALTSGSELTAIPSLPGQARGGAPGGVVGGPRLSALARTFYSGSRAVERVQQRARQDAL